MDAETLYTKKTDYYLGLVWLEATSKNATEFAIEAGKQPNGYSVFIGRSMISEHLKPGRIVLFEGMFVAHDGLEHRQESFQILTNPDNVPVSWCKSSETLANNAILGGTADGCPLYIGRKEHLGHVAVGYVKKDNPFIWYSWDGKEHQNSDYEILCVEEPWKVKTQKRKFRCAII